MVVEATGVITEALQQLKDREFKVTVELRLARKLAGFVRGAKTAHKRTA